MPLDPNVKKVILSKTKKAIDDLQKSKFDGMKKLFTTMIGLTELVSDEVWNKELKLSVLVFGGVGSSTEDEFEEMEKERQDKIIKAYTDFMNSFYRAVEEEDVPKIDDVLRDFAKVFMDEILL